MDGLERQAQLQGMMQQQPQQPPQSPLMSGSIAAMDNIKRAMALDSGQQRQSLGAAIQQFSAHMGRPENHRGGVLGAVAASMPYAVQAYQQAGDAGKTDNMKAFEIMQALEKAQEEKRRHAQGEQHKTAELEETKRYHDLMAGKGGRGSNPYYGMPALAKHMKIQEEIDSGFLPGSHGEVPLTPEQQEQYSNQNQLAMQKITTDSKTRTGALQANNLVKTIDSSNLDALVRYSGPKGAAKLSWEVSKDLAGNPSKEYLEHKEAETAATLEAKEIRQFFGDSITPSVQEALKTLTNPSSPFLSQKTAKIQAEKARDVIRKQLKTLQGALKSTEPYGEDAEKTKPVAPNEDAVQKLVNAGYSTEDIEELYKNGDLK